ncbi:carboxypeptidase regulatory-like domain-containing protein [Nakamurella sp.]|uniref:carboxypeptidase regulatory-like domain-containing protein n=1 Tax=Nakamurella sp. TaxID=1869182 RepID=UPI003B3A1F2F
MTATPPPGPAVTVAPVIEAAAGATVPVTVQVWATGPGPATLSVAIRGLDAEWTPPPVVVGPLAPGEGRTLELELRPGPSALGARYPFVVLAVAADPLGRAEPQAGVAESTLVIGGREPTVLDLDPPQVTAVFGRRVRLSVTNPSATDRDLVIDPTVPAGLTARFDPAPLAVPAGRTVVVRGKVKVRRPRVFGTVQTHSYAVAARGQGAPVVVTGTVRARPVFRGALVRALVLVAVVALWAGLAIVAIPRVSSYFTTQTQNNQAGDAAPDQAAPTTAGSDGNATGTAAGTPGTGGSGNGSGDTTGGSGSGGSGTSGGAGTGDAGPAAPGSAPAGDATGGGTTGGETTGDASGGETTGGDAAPGSGQPNPDGTPGAVALRGLVTGADPGGVTVVLSPTGLTEAAAQGAEPAPGTDEQTASGLRAARAVIGKVPASALRVSTAADPPTVTTTTNDDGTWAIAGIRPTGFYLLTMARAGYQTQRFVVNGATLVGADPMRTELAAGGGAMSGTVTGPDGPIGAATVTITDGHVSVQTASVSPGAEGTPGSWSVTGLSTPGTYLVSAAAQGFGSSSILVTLGAGGTATADLNLPTGAAAVTGLVSGEDLLGRVGGLGGLQVSVTGQSGDVTTTRTATTLTTGPVGTYTLPDLPTPGEYTVTVSGAGYSDQVRQVSLAQGVGSAEVNVSMIRADGVVSGTVTGNPAVGDQPAEGGLIGAGLTLTGPAGSSKTMTTSDPPGSFRFTGVAPGVYVLTGSMFGRISSSVTVEVAAAGEASADLTLLSSADTELPATAHIQGRVTDSRTGGDLTCDRAVDPTVPCVITASVSVPAIDPNTGRIDPNRPPETVSAQAGPGENYVLPAVDDPLHPGLVPGLYTVTITAPGYEPGQVSVQVPQGATMSAAPVSLVPLSLITGRLTTRVGTPAGATCVAVVASGVTPPDRSAGCVADPGGITCTVGGDPSIRCGLIQADGTYQVRGLSHGGYTVVVLPTDPEYIEPAPFSLTIELGSDGRYDPVLDRLGRISVTVREPNTDTGELTLAAGATVAAKQGTTTAAQATSGADGVALLTTLQPGVFQVTANADAGSATADNVSVQLNQTIDLNVALLKPLGTIVARVLTSDGITPGGVGVRDARVTVTGIVGYTGITPVLGSATLITDDNGCIAIVPTQGPPPVTGLPDLCPTVSEPAAIGVAVPGPAFVARPVSVQIDPTSVSQASFTAQIGIAGTGEVLSVPADATTVLPKPSPTSALTLQTLPAGAGRGPAALALLTKPPGSGQVSVQEGPVGTLQWTDTAVTGANLLSPGRYAFAAQLPGFTPSPATAQILCPLGQNCTYVTDPAGTTPAPAPQLIRNPAFAGTLTVLPAGANINGAAFSVTPLNGTPPVTLSASGTTLTWQEQGAPANLVGPGSYSVSVSLPGFESSPVTYTCAAPVTGAETCPLTLTLRQLSTQTVTIQSSVFTGEREVPTGATVLLTGNSVGTIGPLNAQPTGNGSVQVTLPPVSSQDGSYSLTVRAPGFQAATFTAGSTGGIICNGATGLGFQPGPSACQVTLTQLGRITVGTVQTSSDGSVPLPAVSITATPSDGSPAWTATTGDNGQVTLIGTLQRDGLARDNVTYTLTATRAGYDPATTSVTLTPFDLTQAVTLTLPVKPVTLKVNLLDGTTSVVPVGTVRIDGATTSRSCVITDATTPSCIGGDPDITVTGGLVSFARTTPGVYTVSFQPGTQTYQSVSVQTQVATGIDPQTVRINLARRSSSQTGTIRGPGGAALAGAQVSLRQNNDVQQIAKDLSGQPLPTVTTGADGGFAFADVPDGLYRVMVDACGYDRAFSTTITLNSQVAPVPPAVTVQVARTTRSVVVTLDPSTAGLSLAGAPATLQPVAAQPGDPTCTPANTTALTGFTVATDGTVSAPQVPTGRWAVALTPATAPFGAVSSSSFLLDQPDRGVPAPPPDTVPTAPTVTVSATVRLAPLTMTATWPAGCSPAPTAVSLVLTPDGGTARTLPATITPGAGNAGTATVSALVPAGSYTWSVGAGTFTADPATGTFTVPGTGSTTAVSLAVTLLAPAIGVTPTATVDGAARTGLPVTATRGGQTVTADGAGQLCVAPGAGWTFSVRSTADPTMLIPDVSGVTVTRAGPNTVTFTGFTLRPGVALTAVPRRPADTTARSVDLTLTLGGATTWSGSVTVPAGASSATGPLLTVGAGTYTLAAAASAPFGTASTTGIDPSTTHTATVTMPYTAVTLGVTASIGGAASAGATITLTPAAGGSPKTTPASGPALFADIAAGTYTITATQTVGGTQYQGALTGQALAAGQSPLLDVPMTAVPPAGP